MNGPLLSVHVAKLVDPASARRASLAVVGNHGARSPLLGSVSADVARRPEVAP